MSSTVAGSSAAENMIRLADYNVHIIIRGLIWDIVKNLLERLVTETPFELTFVNNPESGRVENRDGLAKMMKSVTPHGEREILKKLDNTVLAELLELFVLPTEDVPDRKKLQVIVILYPAPLRSLENSVEFAVKGLVDAILPADRISIQFVQVGFSRKLFEALKDVVENDYTNLADFTTSIGSMADQRLGRIPLASVHPTFSRPPDTPQPTSHPIPIMPADNPPASQESSLNIATFVIYTPTRDDQSASAPPPSPTGTVTALRQEDVPTLEDEFTEGGVIFSLHSPDKAIAWLEAHYEDPLIISIRAHGLGGPLAAMLSPDVPALSIFGSILDSWVLRAAKLLSDMSGFAVMIRPLMDNPVPKWTCAAADVEDPGLPGAQLRPQSPDVEDTSEPIVDDELTNRDESVMSEEVSDGDAGSDGDGKVDEGLWSVF
ncbi:hypothetical protein B0H10DRAFT_2233522 [Mycena sp. CBHHK59/15]|nr:hypothetical protein B0H10DRAFT_2233522 [Mycena sp. CBHHK59/15]